MAFTSPKQRRFGFAQAADKAKGLPTSPVAIKKAGLSGLPDRAGRAMPGSHATSIGAGAKAYQKPRLTFEAIPPEGSDPGADPMNAGNRGGLL
jgi:hypothetical protein